MSDLEKNKLVEGGVYSVDFSDYSFSSEISQKKEICNSHKKYQRR